MLVIDITDTVLFECNVLDTTRGALFILKVNPRGKDCKYNAIPWSTFKLFVGWHIWKYGLKFLNPKLPSP